MERQLAIMKEYQHIFSDKITYKLISEHTGIQLTRIFRLFNGYAMRLDEYLIFENIIREAQGKDQSLYSLLDHCMQDLSFQSLNIIKQSMEKKLRLSHLQQRKAAHSKEMHCLVVK